MLNDVIAMARLLLNGSINIDTNMIIDNQWNSLKMYCSHYYESCYIRVKDK